jgi:hypothetical protein
MALKVNDAPSKEKLNYINKILEEMNKMDKEADYKAAIDRGNNNYKIKNWSESLSAFRDALTYKPADIYSKSKIAELEKLVKLEVVTVAVPKRNPLLEKYSEGVTEETLNSPGCQITRRIVIKGTEAKLYEKKYYSFGALQFYRDGQQISQSVFEMETK